MIRQALEDIDPGGLEQKMRSVLEAKYRTLKGDPREKLKLLKFALSRGYDYESVAGVVDEILGS